MTERITPKDFSTGSPKRIIGTEAEDHVGLKSPKQITDIEDKGHVSPKVHKLTSSCGDDYNAIETLLSGETFRKANIRANTSSPPRNNRWLANGQRIYQDGEMLESCTAEQLGPKRALAGTLAGVKVVRQLAEASELDIRIFRRSATVDQNGHLAKAAFHMNHITPAETSKNLYGIEAMEAHSATRLYTWGGMVAPDGFTLSQKSHAYSGFSPFYKFKNEGSGFIRLEDYSGEDSSPWGTFMAMATTSVLLRVIEHPELTDLNRRLGKVRLEDPGRAIGTVSADITLKEKLPLADGRRLSAIEIQAELADIASEFGKRFTLPEDEQYAVDQWQIVCKDLKEAAKTGDIKPLAKRIGWVSKKLWLERKKERDDIGPLQADNPDAVRLDMDWDCLYPNEGGRLQYPRRTGLMIVSDPEVIELVANPPQDTRAVLRGKYIHPSYVIENWSRVKAGYGVKIEFHPYQTS